MLFKIFIQKLEKIAGFLKLHPFNQPYWVEISTQSPKCIYYFGPFDSYIEAENMQQGYVDDLAEEEAIGIKVKIKRCMPTKLTIEE